MKSSMCNGGEHEYCGTVMKKPEGKHFRCDCSCHPKEVKIEKEIEDDDESSKGR